MSFWGTFIKGAMTGIIGLGVVSWLVSTLDNEQQDKSDYEEEE